MKILVTGKNGQLGYDVLKALSLNGIEGIGADIEEFDLTDQEQTSKYIIDNKPGAVIHCAAYTAVDRAEDEPEKCYKINVEGTLNVAIACKKIGAKLLYVSTDYVFSGMGAGPYETDSMPEPLSVYGKTKYEGENTVRNNTDKHFIIRTSWVFGKNGNNFVKTMLKLGLERDSLNVVSDQIGSPTYTVDLAKLIVNIILTEKYGTYHGTNEGYCNWAEFAAEIMQQSGLKTKIVPINTEQYPTKAIRPKKSQLSKRSLSDAGFERLPKWQDALRRYLIELEIIS